MKYIKFEKKLKEWNLNENEIHLVKKIIDKNASIIKAMNINLLNFNSYSDLMETLDNLTSIKMLKAVNAAIPKELIKFKNDNSVFLLKTLLNYITEDQIREVLFKNRDTINSSKKLENFIFKECQLYFDTSKKEIEEKISTMKSIHTVINESGLLVLRVDDHQSLLKINPSKNWCITQNKKYFNSYKSNYGLFYLLIDYKKDVKDDNYMIGFNKNKNGLLSGFNSKNESIIEPFIENIIGNYFHKLENDVQRNCNHQKEVNKTKNNPYRYYNRTLEESIAHSQEVLTKMLKK